MVTFPVEELSFVQNTADNIWLDLTHLRLTPEPARISANFPLTPSTNPPQGRDGLIAIFPCNIEMRDGAHLPVVDRI